MKNWHTCETVHCLAGWACVLSPAGKDLESRLGTAVAGALLVPDLAQFFHDSDTARADAFLKTLP